MRNKWKVSCLISFVLLMMLAVNVHANIVPLRFGVNLPQRSSDDIFYFYEYQAPDTGYLTVKANHACVTVMKERWNNFNMSSSYGNNEVIPVVKGYKYYLRNDGDDTSSIKITKFTRAVNKDNYCAENAVQLKRKKWMHVIQTLDENYCRWYKITLPRKQVLTYMSNSCWGYNIFDSRWKSVSFKNGKQDEAFSGIYRYVSKHALPAGTYYVRMPYARDMYFKTYTGSGVKVKKKPNAAYVMSFMWN